MDELLQVWTRIVWAQCWQVTLLIVSVWLVLRAVGQNRPHLACALWLVVLLKCITPPLVSSPSGIFCWLQRTEPAVEGQSVLAATIVDFEPAIAPEDDAIVVQASPTIAPAPSPAVAAPLELPAASEIPVEPVAQAIWFWSLVVSLAAFMWLLGVLVFAAVAIAQWLRCWRKLTRAGRMDEAPLAELVDDLRRRLALRRSVRLLVTESSLGPAVVGLWRPTIILPAAIVREKTPAELAPLVAHELIHIRRGDLWIGLLQTLALGLWWFHPLVRLASRLITRESERCCDEETIAHLGCDPAAYARSLLDVLALKQELTPIPAFPGVRPVDVTIKRLERIMKLGQGCHKRSPWWCWLIMLAAAAVVLPGAALVVGAKENPPVQAPARMAVGAGDADTPPTRASDEELVTRDYDVSRLMAELRSERSFSEVGAKAYVAALIRSAAPGTDRMKWDLDGRRIRQAPDGHRQIDEQLAVITIRQTAAAHKRIAEQLAVLDAHGHAELAIEVRIVSGPKAMPNAAGVDWRMIGDSETEHEPEQRNRPAKLRGTAESVVQRHVPAMLALVDDAQAKELIDTAQSDRRTNVLQAPKVALFNGQSARIEDIVQRPFVVGVTPAADGETTTLKPTIRVFSEGTTIRLRPVAKKDGPIQLDFGLTLSQIRDVETAEFPTGPGKQPITVQVPEVASTRLNTTVEMNAEQTLVLAIPKLGKGKKEQQPMAVMVKVRRIKEAGEQEQAAAPTQAAFSDLTKSGDEHRPAQAIQSTSPANPARERIVIETSGWRFIFTPRKDALEIGHEGDKNSLPSLRILGGTKFEAIAANGGAESEHIAAEVDSAHVSSRPATANAPAFLQIRLEGDVQLACNESRIQAKHVLLRLEDPFPAGTEPGRKPARFQIQVQDASAIDLSGTADLPEHFRFFFPGPVNAQAQFIEKAYPVADLVIPVPSGPIKISPSGSQVKRETPEPGKADFDSLIDLITTTVNPSSWESFERGGGAGKISIATNSLSLVIHQEETVHQRIADLLNGLRRLQDIQVVLTLERMEVPAAELESAASKEPDSPLGSIIHNPQSRAWCLKPESVSALKRLPSAKVETGPKITAFNGQSVDLRLGEGAEHTAEFLSGLLIQPVVTADFRSLRLQVFGDTAPQSPHIAEQQQQGPFWLASSKVSPARQLPVELRELALGRVLVVDESQYAWQEREKGVPMADKVPANARLFKNVSAKKPETRHFYLITPNVLVASEEDVLAPR